MNTAEKVGLSIAVVIAAAASAAAGGWLLMLTAGVVFHEFEAGAALGFWPSAGLYSAGTALLTLVRFRAPEGSK